MRRALVVAAACLLLCTACRPRVDVTTPAEEPAHPAPTAVPDTSPTEPGTDDGDDMADYAWQVYSRAIEKEAGLESYSVVYENREYVLGQSTVSRASLIRKAAGETVELYLRKEGGDSVQSGYYIDGIGYFDMGSRRYWLPTDEEHFLSAFGFSESKSLTREMFDDAIAVPAEEGYLTVSCPLSEPYASAYVRETLGEKTGMQVRRVEMDVTVDAEGLPREYFTTLTLWVPRYGEITYEAVSRCEAVGEDVVLIPPADLDEYTQDIP